MNKSILHFNEIGIKKIEKGLKNFMEYPDNLDAFADTVLPVLLSFGLDILKESIEDADRSIRESPERKRKWNINRREKTQLLCCLGTWCTKGSYSRIKRTVHTVICWMTSWSWRDMNE